MERRKQRLQRGGVGRAFSILLAAVLILGLSGIVMYLLSDLNRRRYRIATKGEALLVEKGRYLPVGYERYIPQAEALKKAYAPIPVPKNHKPGRPEVFDDRADVDRALFGILAGWARQGLEAKEPEALKLAATYIERCQALPGLSEQQRIELRTLRADLAYHTGRRMLGRVVELLHESLAEFKLSVALGTSRPNNANEWIADIERRIAAYTGQTPTPETIDGPVKTEDANPDSPEGNATKTEKKDGDEDTTMKKPPGRWQL